MTTYPFPLPEHLQQRLPVPSRDGKHYLDVRVEGKWDGVLVVNAAGMCIGIYLSRHVEEYPLPFEAHQIEDIRRASLLNCFLAALALDLWHAAMLTIIVASPISLLLALLVSPLFAMFSVVACGAAIYIMCLAPGIRFIRLPVVALGLAQIASGGMLLLRLLP